MDLVVTWVNMSDPRWIRVANAPGGDLQDVEADHGFSQQYPYNPSGRSLAGNFLELKYCLRSMAKFGLMKYVRHVHVVHSDLHDPPNYLKNHPRLKFVPHSVIFRGVPGNPLPTMSRNAIDSRFHHIPGLADWFLRLDDDFYLLQPVQPRDFWREAKLVVHGQIVPCEQASDGYSGAMANSACLLQERFGTKYQRRYLDHWPVMSYRPAIEELEALFKDRWLATAEHALDRSSDIFWGAITQMYMVRLPHLARSCMYAYMCQR
jgi:hypothetical protein